MITSKAQLVVQRFEVEERKRRSTLNRVISKLTLPYDMIPSISRHKRRLMERIQKLHD